MAGLVGGTIRAWDDPQMKVVSLTKNPALQKQIDAGLSDYGTVKASGQQALGDYIKE